MAVSSPGIATLSFTAISRDMAISLLMARVPVAGQTPKLAANWRHLILEPLKTNLQFVRDAEGRTF